MILSFNRSYLSILDFPSIEVPKFTLITGMNGSGKSHLLEAIKNGSIGSSIPGYQPNETPLYNWSNLVPQNAQAANSSELSARRENVWQQIKNAQEASQYRDNIINIARSAGVPNEYLNDPGRLLSYTDNELRGIPGLEEKAGLHAALQNQAQHWAVEIYNRSGNLLAVKQICKDLKKHPAALREDDLFNSPFLDWTNNTNIFQQSFSTLFVAYRDRLITNGLRTLAFQAGDEPQGGLSPGEFRDKNGPPPWEFLNEALAAASLGFQIDHPKLYSSDNYLPRLTKIESGKEVAFQNLSSGEKIIMSFAICVYQASDERQLFNKPAMILLDEVDAPLHPSMKKNFISTITDVLISRYDIHVIATTHSPSTAALAPENSLYIMQGGELGLRKVSKGEALNILTVGVPSIAIGYDGRRQVFVESPADATVYDKLYQNLKGFLASERSLSFISTGSRSKIGQDTNTGCDIVLSIVSKLVDEGNTSVFGLVDWDGNKVQNGRVSVLAGGRRNGLENVILDPLLLAVFLKKGHHVETRKFEQLGQHTFLTLCNAQPPELQLVVDEISLCVLGSAKTDQISARYLGGFEIQIDSRCATTDDHRYEEMVLAAFPCLKLYSRGAGTLMSAIVDGVLREKPSFAPCEIITTFKHILDAPAHI